MSFKAHSPCEFMHDLYIAEIYKPGAIFLPLTSQRAQEGRGIL